MLHIGCHLSVSKGYANMGHEALSIKADTFQFFTRNPRGGKAKAFDKQDAEALTLLMKENDFAPIVAHAPYTMNLCAAKEDLRNFAIDMMKDDMMRLDFLPGNYYNFHPGSHVGQGTEIGIQKIADALNQVLPQVENSVILLETMAGKGSEVGGCFEDLQAIIERVEQNEKLGVCLDTCHVYDAGYDIAHKLDEVLDEFDSIIGLDKLKAIHLNDSKNPFESHKDRHEVIGEGSLGLETFVRIINHPRLKNLPFILETPNELPGYAAEISLLRKLYK